jgi:ABC-2 type transport system ATP-binding protein
MTEAALKVDGASHSYGGKPALKNVSLEVGAGRFTVLLGLNGAGKSTLFSLISRLFTTKTGRFAVAGADMARDGGAALQALGIVFQSRTLDPDLSVMQNFLYVGALHGIGRRESRGRAEQLLQKIGLAERANDKVRALSGGQMRRVEIARALLHQPRLLLLDEPTVGLDYQARADILAHVRDLAANDGVGVLWATHLIDEAEGGDDLIVLHRGEVAAAGTVESIIAQTGAADLTGAFRQLTGMEPAR